MSQPFSLGYIRICNVTAPSRAPTHGIEGLCGPHVHHHPLGVVVGPLGGHELVELVLPPPPLEGIQLVPLFGVAALEVHGLPGGYHGGHHHLHHTDPSG